MHSPFCLVLVALIAVLSSTSSAAPIDGPSPVQSANPMSSPSVGVSNPVQAVSSIIEDVADPVRILNFDDEYFTESNDLGLAEYTPN